MKYPSDGRAWIGAEVPPELAQDFRAQASAQDRSVASHLRHVLRHYLAQNDNDPAGNRVEVNSGGRGSAHVTE